MNVYKFYIIHNSITTEVFPLYSGLKFSYKKDGFRYSKECKTEFTFQNKPKESTTDFTTILAIENGLLRCETIDFEIKRTCDNGVTYDTYWVGSFSVNDGEFNLDQCTFKTAISVVDKYSCLTNNKSKKINILQSGPLITIESEHQDVPSEIQYYGCVNGFCSPGPAYTLISSVALTSHHNGGINTDPIPVDLQTYAREIIFTNDIAGVSQPPTNDPEWVLINDVSGVSLYARPYVGGSIDVVVVAGPLTDGIENLGTGNFDPPTTPYCPDGSLAPATISGHVPYELVWNNFSYIPVNNYPTSTPKYQCIDIYFAKPFNTITEFSRFHNIYDALVYLVNEICPDINGIVSDFFEWNPIGDAPGYFAGYNYVSGGPNVIANMAIAQKSDVLIPVPSQYATIGEVSFDQLIKDICTMFNCDWFVDDSGNLRIEHVSYFTFILGFNSTVAPHTKWNIANNTYSYRKEKMPSRESFTFMESQGSDFVGKDIVYSGACVSDDSSSLSEKAYNVIGFTTDMNFIDNYPGSIDKHGFAMVVYDPADNKVIQEVGKITGALINNGHLSWANLHYNYHRHGRVLLEGNMNGVSETFFTAIPTKLQKSVKLQVCCADDFNPTGILIQTELGLGEVETAEEENNIITMQINL